MIKGKILRTEESTDGRKNIKITVEFSKDGQVIVPEWALWARYENFLGMTPTQISEWIRVNIEHQIGNLIKASYRGDINTAVMNEINKMVGTEYQKDSVEVVMEANVILPAEYTVTIKDDGTITVVK